MCNGEAGRVSGNCFWTWPTLNIMILDVSGRSKLLLFAIAGGGEADEVLQVRSPASSRLLCNSKTKGHRKSIMMQCTAIHETLMKQPMGSSSAMLYPMMVDRDAQLSCPVGLGLRAPLPFWSSLHARRPYHS